MKRSYAPYDAFTTADEDRVDELLVPVGGCGLAFPFGRDLPILENNGVFMFFLADHFSQTLLWNEKKSASCE